MRKITLSNGKEYVVNPLSGKDVREMNEMGAVKDGISDLFCSVQRAGFGPEITDDLPFPDVMALNRAVTAETFGLPEEEKN